jgi:hypothetical protein
MTEQKPNSPLKTKNGSREVQFIELTVGNSPRSHNPSVRRAILSFDVNLDTLLAGDAAQIASLIGMAAKDLLTDVLEEERKRLTWQLQ